MNYISKDMLRKGYDNEIVRLGVDPNMGSGTVCVIGTDWFYFGGRTAADESPEEYAEHVPTEDIINEIYDTLEDFRKDRETFGDEYEYCFLYLSEELNKVERGMNIITVKATFEFELEVDTEGLFEEYVDRKGLAIDLTKEEVASLLNSKSITKDDFNYQIQTGERQHTQKDKLDRSER